MRRVAFLLLTLALPCAADELLDRARQNFAERLERTPNFTCLMEIGREVFASASARRFQTRDRTRLEISVVDGQELFAWPGEDFAERPLIDFLGPGVASTGEFSVHGRTILTDERTWIEELTESSKAGLAGYRYRVPAEASRYVVMSAQGAVVAPYEGAFWVDTTSAQMVRLEVRLPRSPAGTDVNRASSGVEYALSAVGSTGAWLPVRSELEVEFAQGAVARNRMTFSHCRSYDAETTISFGETSETASEQSEWEDTRWTIPAGLDLRIELRENLSSDRAWAGDRFTASVVRDVKGGGRLLLGKGDVAGGRVVGIETIDTTPLSVRSATVRRMTAISLMLDEIRRDGECAPLTATLELVERMPGMGRIDPGGRAEIDRSAYSSNRAATYDTSPKMSSPGLGTFIVHGELFLVREGTRMRWTTEAGPQTGCANR